MSVRTRTRRPVVMILGGVVALALLAGAIWAWANTDVFGKETFCGKVLEAGEVDSILSGSGRLSDNSTEHDEPYGFTCEVERAQKIGGGPPAVLSTELALQPADFALSSRRVWDGHASYSYFTGERAGAVSHERGWLLLPQECLGTVPNSVRGDPLWSVQVEVENARPGKSDLAAVLLRIANHVTTKMGCDTTDRWRSAPIDLREPTGAETRPDDAQLCGNSLTAPGALPEGRLSSPERERYTATGSTTGACELAFPGREDRRLTFTWSADSMLVHGASLEGVGRNTSKATDRVLVPCGDEEIYAHVHSSDAYGAALEDATSTQSEATVMRGWLRSYAKALASEHGCPSSGE
ncbi:hypothetical protein [Streptomyces sulphureus]|uniref:hypothetical protein n=1 Tax=Streptomyces sulphureus TaxID=47758 RepID=UPI001FE16435|nr:hypothetical protein [Streptomyces sulphureus]